jgi:hypothetical protein
MSTDIADKNLKVLRDMRWEKAFSDGRIEGDEDLLNRKATVMIDCLLQASDIAHTMQHWHIYRKWVRLVRGQMECEMPKLVSKCSSYLCTCLLSFRTSFCSKNCTSPFCKADVKRTPLSFGMMERLASLTFTS